MAVRPIEDGSYFYVFEPDEGRHADERARLTTNDGKIVTRRKHGYEARVEVVDEAGELGVATLLRAASAFGRALERTDDALGRTLCVRLTTGAEGSDAGGVKLPASFVANAPIHHPVDAKALELVQAMPARNPPLETPVLPECPARRVLFFESLMNSDLPHNDCEISQGVLHMASTLRGAGVDVALANVKMSIVGAERPVKGLEQLERALANGPVDLV